MVKERKKHLQWYKISSLVDPKQMLVVSKSENQKIYLATCYATEALLPTCLRIFFVCGGALTSLVGAL